ncbi:GPI anchored serine-threonine rich family protein [Hyalangium versicolor]|uniref:GPI anchored serine-threonine rich family protein n=1 Tax=Hyalangium versicolor TaxID=2861190 RepID=UPI001CCAB17F|nr:GPI anchored serine-threonine rich family protein [Hyalangium versicolor]
MSRSTRSPCSRRLLPSLAALGLLAGCGRTETRPVSLADLSDRALTYTLVDIDSLVTPDAAGSHRFTLKLAQASDGCTQLVEGVTATFNGQPMELEPGGISESGGREVCEETRAWFDFDPEAWDAEPIEDARIFLQSQDGTSALSLIVSGAKTKRHITFQGAGSGATLRQGQTYTYRWEPVDETPGPVTVTLLREDGRAPATLETAQEGGNITFMLPQATPVAKHLLTLSGSLVGQVLQCEGVASCEGGIFHSTDFEISVAP